MSELLWSQSGLLSAWLKQLGGNGKHDSLMFRFRAAANLGRARCSSAAVQHSEFWITAADNDQWQKRLWGPSADVTPPPAL